MQASTIRFAFAALLAQALLVGPVIAQSSPSTGPSTSPSTGTMITPGSLVSQQDVMSLLSKNGYTSITGLEKDSTGNWHGNAVHNGARVRVAVDSSGHITTN